MSYRRVSLLCIQVDIRKSENSLFAYPILFMLYHLRLCFSKGYSAFSSKNPIKQSRCPEAKRTVCDDPHRLSLPNEADDDYHAVYLHEMESNEVKSTNGYEKNFFFLALFVRDLFATPPFAQHARIWSQPVMRSCWAYILPFSVSFCLSISQCMLGSSDSWCTLCFPAPVPLLTGQINSQLARVYAFVIDKKPFMEVETVSRWKSAIILPIRWQRRYQFVNLFGCSSRTKEGNVCRMLLRILQSLICVAMTASVRLTDRRSRWLREWCSSCKPSFLFHSSLWGSR